ncbi:SDR family NAD(P)-dependent oxidoreductase, partial [bacterium]|nr:SDR family NAD(P)-dependent oxidoreductase [bacterium]
MDLGIQGKVALVAASSDGLGLATAKGLSREGVKVVICSRNEENLEVARKQIADQANSDVVAIRADLTQPKDVSHLVSKVVEIFGTIHILVNNAGGPPAGFFPDMTDEHWQKGVDLTLMSSVRLTRATLPFMKEQRWGRIINITSVSVKQPINELLLSNSLRLSIIGWS